MSYERCHKEVVVFFKTASALVVDLFQMLPVTLTTDPDPASDDEHARAHTHTHTHYKAERVPPGALMLEKQ